MQPPMQYQTMNPGSPPIAWVLPQWLGFFKSHCFFLQLSEHSSSFRRRHISWCVPVKRNIFLRFRVSSSFIISNVFLVCWFPGSNTFETQLCQHLDTSPKSKAWSSGDNPPASLSKCRLQSTALCNCYTQPQALFAGKRSTGAKCSLVAICETGSLCRAGTLKLQKMKFTFQWCCP
jgi:hypothetical protein